MSYLNYLRSSNFLQHKVEEILEKHKSQPVGSGYIDLITSSNQIQSLISELTSIGIAINGVTW